jgi:hypothetical protein
MVKCPADLAIPIETVIDYAFSNTFHTSGEFHVAVSISDNQCVAFQVVSTEYFKGAKLAPLPLLPPADAFLNSLHPDYHHSPGNQYQTVHYGLKDLVPGYLTKMDKVADLMSNPDYIQHNPYVREMWRQYFRQLYNTDIDLITEFCSDAEFDGRAADIAHHVRRATGGEVSIEKVGVSPGYRWKIRPAASDYLPIDLYRNSFGSIFRYHLPAVRAAHAPAADSHVYLSNAASILTGYCQDRRWVKCTQSAMSVPCVYANRFYTILLSQREAVLMMPYIEKLPATAQLNIGGMRRSPVVSAGSIKKTIWEYKYMDSPPAPPKSAYQYAM